MRLIIKSAIVCLLVCLGIAARVEVDIVPDVVYCHKDCLAVTMNVLKPKNANGAGILCLVSGGWHSNYDIPPNAALAGGAPYPYCGWFDCRTLLDKGFT